MPDSHWFESWASATINTVQVVLYLPFWAWMCGLAPHLRSLYKEEEEKEEVEEGGEES